MDQTSPNIKNTLRVSMGGGGSNNRGKKVNPEHKNGKARMPEKKKTLKALQKSYKTKKTLSPLNPA